MGATRDPQLWHIEISHFSEKVRWALDYKSVAHRRHAPMPGLHIAVALALTGGRQHTLPVLELDGRRIGDSTAIIAALERRYPEPPLYPEDAADRARALALEDYFDAQVGPHIRRYMFHELRRDRQRLADFSRQAAPPVLAPFGRIDAAYARAFTATRYGAGDDGAMRARDHVVAALDRLEAELGDDEYLVGGRFTVADLTAAALLYALVMPPEGPRGLPVPEPVARFRASLADRPGVTWVGEMFRRHRRPQLSPRPEERQRA
jgi:glutathione S-transferase